MVSNYNLFFVACQFFAVNLLIVAVILPLITKRWIDFVAFLALSIVMISPYMWFWLKVPMHKNAVAACCFFLVVVMFVWLYVYLKKRGT